MEYNISAITHDVIERKKKKKIKIKVKKIY